MPTLRLLFAVVVLLPFTATMHAQTSYIATQGNTATQIFDAHGKVIANVNVTGKAIAFDRKGNLFVGESTSRDGRHTIWRVPYVGIAKWGDPQVYCTVGSLPRAMVVGDDRAVYIGVLEKSNVYKCGAMGAEPKLYCGVNNDSRAIQDIGIGPDGKVWLGLVAWGYLRFGHDGGFKPELTIYNKGKVGGLAFGPDRNGDGKAELYGSVDEAYGAIGTYDAATGEKLGTIFNDPDSHNYCLSFGPDRSGDGAPDIYVATYDDRTRIYDTMTGKRLGEIAAGLSNIYLADVHGLPTAPPQAVAVDAATRFFKSHPNTIDLEDRDGSIYFANRHVGIEIKQRGADFRLSRIYGIADEQDFLLQGAGEMFTLAMTLDPKHVKKDRRALTLAGAFNILDQMAGDVFNLRSSGAASATWRREDGDDFSTLFLTWKNFSAREDKQVVDVEVAITLRNGDPLSRWRINVTNRSQRYGIERVRFPTIDFAPIGEAKDNVLILPEYRGSLDEAPFKHKNTEAFYPHSYNMQFQALYNNESGAGVYFGSQDPAANFVVHDVFQREKEITWRFGQFPPNITFSAEDYVQPFDCVIGPFHGDWYDASQIYRDWALKQYWCRKGPLKTRDDIPTWYKQMPIFLYTFLTDTVDGTHSIDENLLVAEKHFKEILAWAKVPLAANYYGWRFYTRGQTSYQVPFNPWRMQYQGRWANIPTENTHDGNYPKIGAIKEFAASCKRLRDAGGMVNPYVALELFDQGPADNSPYADEAQHHAVRGLYGAKRTWGAEATWQMCVATDWWQNRMKETGVELARREHVGGLYLDVMQGSGLPCYWTPHGHTAAGGDSMTRSMHDMVELITDAFKKQAPDAITTGENPSENVLDVTDGFLQVTMSPLNKAPIFAAVYQDYIPRYGLEISLSTEAHVGTPQEHHFFLQCASMFVEGMQIGRLRLRPRSSSFDIHKPENKPMVDYLGQMVGYYRQDVAKKFLCYGKLLRPLDLSGQVPSLAYRDGSKFPALMTGVFASDDGEMAVFVVNASTAPTKLASILSPKDYPLPGKSTTQVTNISPSGEATLVHRKTSDLILLSRDMPARSVTMFHITP